MRVRSLARGYGFFPSSLLNATPPLSPLLLLAMVSVPRRIPPPCNSFRPPWTASPCRCLASRTNPVPEHSASIATQGKLTTNFERRAGLRCLRAYLIHTRGWNEDDAVSVTRCSPRFLEYMLLSCRVPGTEMLRSRCDSFLHENDFDGRELLLESIGVEHSKMDQVLPLVRRDLAGENGLLAIVSILRSIGYTRNQLWGLFDRERRLLDCIPEQLIVAVRGLRRLGLKRCTISALIRESPGLLLIDVEDRTASQLALLQRFGVPRSVIAACFMYCPRQFMSMQDSDLARSIKTCVSLGLSSKVVAKAVIKYPRFLFLLASGQFENVIRTLGDLGFSKSAISHIVLTLHFSIFNSRFKVENVELLVSLGLDRAIVLSVISRYPQLLIRSFHRQVKPIIEFLQNHGMSSEDIMITMKRHPRILGASLELKIKPFCKYLESKSLDKETVGRVIRTCPQVVGFCLEKTVKASVSALEGLGFKDKALAKLVAKNPTLLRGILNGTFGKKIDFLAACRGSSLESKDLVRALRGGIVNAQAHLMEERFENLVALGFSHSEACALVNKLPEVLGRSKQLLQKKAVFLFDTMHRTTAEVVEYPFSLTLSLENRMRPRYRVCTYLQENRLLDTQSLNLRSLFAVSDKVFFEKFVKPFPNPQILSEIFEDKVGS